MKLPEGLFPSIQRFQRKPDIQLRCMFGSCMPNVFKEVVCQVFFENVICLEVRLVKKLCFFTYQVFFENITGLFHQ